MLKDFEFVKKRIQNSGPLKYTNAHYGCPVVTSQEQFILLNNLETIQACEDNIFEVVYSMKSQDWDFKRLSEVLVADKMNLPTSPSQLNMLKTQ